jgi:hypothetical protein
VGVPLPGWFNLGLDNGFLWWLLNLKEKLNE